MSSISGTSYFYQVIGVQYIFVVLMEFNKYELENIKGHFYYSFIFMFPRKHETYFRAKQDKYIHTIKRRSRSCYI